MMVHMCIRFCLTPLGRNFSPGRFQGSFAEVFFNFLIFHCGNLLDHLKEAVNDLHLMLSGVWADIVKELIYFHLEIVKKTFSLNF